MTARFLHRRNFNLDAHVRGRGSCQVADHRASIVRNQDSHSWLFRQPALADSIPDLLPGFGLHLVEAKLFDDGDNLECGSIMTSNLYLPLEFGIQSVVSMPTASQAAGGDLIAAGGIWPLELPPNFSTLQSSHSSRRAASTCHFALPLSLLILAKL